MRVLRRLIAFAVLLCPFVAGAQTIGCSSDDGNRHYCKANTQNGVTLTNQTSGAPCQQGYSWGYDEGGIWVDHGCRAYFTLGIPAGGTALYCASDDGGRHYCPTDTRMGIVMVQQRSGAACQQGYSWGFDERGIWVDHGCRADFAPQGPPPYPGAGNVVGCSSDDGGRHYCQADTRGDVELLRQRSHAACIQGSTWGFDRNGIWVDQGCRAEFVVVPNEQPYYTGMPNGPSQTVTCSSEDGRKHYCNADTRGGVQLVNQRSGDACQQGYSWGYDDQGIWVDHGCRADFVAFGGAGGERRQMRECRRSIGEQRANELVQQCLQVSPGTHPPCNAENSCRVITDEIRRSCELLGRDAPGFCNEYQ